MAPRTGTPQQIELADLHLDEVLDKGGQGEVWSLTNRPDEVFKRYFVSGVEAGPLASLVNFPATLSSLERRSLLESAAWPTTIVVDKKLPAGFLMRRVPAEFCARTLGTERQLRELQYLLFEPKPLWGDIEPLDSDGRLELARRFVELVRILHARTLVLGDISMRNVLWAPGDPPRLFVLDCDSARYEQGRSVLPQANTPDWNDPHAQPNSSDLDSDRYKLALFVVRVLSRDAYIRPGVVPTLLPEIDEQIAALVIKTFERAAGSRGTRPDAGEWARTLSGRASIPLTPPAPRPPVPALPLADLDGRGEREMIQLRPFPSRS